MDDAQQAYVNALKEFVRLRTQSYGAATKFEKIDASKNVVRFKAFSENAEGIVGLSQILSELGIKKEFGLGRSPVTTLDVSIPQEPELSELTTLLDLQIKKTQRSLFANEVENLQSAIGKIFEGNHNSSGKKEAADLLRSYAEELSPKAEPALGAHTKRLQLEKEISAHAAEGKAGVIK